MSEIDPIDRMLGNNLRFLRLMRGLTQSDVGRMLNVTFQQIQKYEQGRNRISARTLCKLKTALHVEYEDFFNPLAGSSTPSARHVHDRIIMSAIRHLTAIPSLQKQRAIVTMIKEFAEE